MSQPFPDPSEPSWTPLVERLDSLPLILAGPILRRIESHAVTVWAALRAPWQVTLRVYQWYASPAPDAPADPLPAAEYRASLQTPKAEDAPSLP